MRDRRTVRDEIAAHVAAFANAEGGTPVLGVEDDGTVTGHGYPDEAVETFLQVPATRLQPPLKRGERGMADGQEILVFSVDSAAVPVMVSGDGFPFRAGDSVILLQEHKIQALKQTGLVESAEARLSPGIGIAVLDETLVRQAAESSGLGDLDPEAFLILALMREHGIPRIFKERETSWLPPPEFFSTGIDALRAIPAQRHDGAARNAPPGFPDFLLSEMGEE